MNRVTVRTEAEARKLPTCGGVYRAVLTADSPDGLVKAGRTWRNGRTGCCRQRVLYNMTYWKFYADLLTQHPFDGNSGAGWCRTLEEAEEFWKQHIEWEVQPMPNASEDEIKAEEERWTRQYCPVFIRRKYRPR